MLISHAHTASAVTSCVDTVTSFRFKAQAQKIKKNRKTYNIPYSHVVTHHTTNGTICSLNMAERTGCLTLYSLWSYVLDEKLFLLYKDLFVETGRKFLILEKWVGMLCMTRSAVCFA